MCVHGSGIEDIVDGIHDQEIVADIEDTADGGNDQETVVDNEYTTYGIIDQETVTDIEDTTGGSNNKETVANIEDTADGGNDQEAGTDIEDTTCGSNEKETVADIKDTADGRNDQETVADIESTTDDINDTETEADIGDTTDGSNDKYGAFSLTLNNIFDKRAKTLIEAQLKNASDNRMKKRLIYGKKTRKTLFKEHLSLKKQDTGVFAMTNKLAAIQIDSFDTSGISQEVISGVQLYCSVRNILNSLHSDGGNDQETKTDIEDTTNDSYDQEKLADIEGTTDGSYYETTDGINYETVSLQRRESISVHNKAKHLSRAQLNNAIDCRMKKRLIYRKKTRKALDKEHHSLKKQDTGLFAMTNKLAAIQIEYRMKKQTTYEEKAQEALVWVLRSLCKPDSFDTPIKFIELIIEELQLLQYQLEMNHICTIHKQDYVDTSGKLIEEIKKLQLHVSHIEISNAIHKHDLDLFTFPKIPAATRIDDWNRVLAFPGIGPAPTYLTQSLVENHEKYLMLKSIFDLHLGTEMEAKKLLNFFEENSEYILEKYNQIIIKHFINSQKYLITKTLSQLPNDSITYIRQKVLMDVTWLHQEICKTRYLKFSRIIKISQILYEGLTVLLSEIFTMNHAQQTLLCVMILCYLIRENQSNLADENITPPKKESSSFTLNVISSNVFRNAMDGIRYSMYELAYTRFFPSNCRMFIDIPINRFGFLGRSEKKGM